MNEQRRRGFFSLLRVPEVQFFLIFSIPFLGFFFVNYNALPPAYRLTVLIVCIATVVIVLMQTVYSIYAHAAQQRAENTFLSMSAHQMRTPVTALRWIFGELKKQDVREADRLELLRMGEIAGTKLANMVEVFLQTTRVRDYRLHPIRQATDGAAFIEQIMHESEPLARQYGVSIDFQKPPRGIDLLINPETFEVALATIIHNAIIYNRSGGMVTIHLRELVAEHEVEITVEDTGIGMSQQDLAKVFTKYYRGGQAQQKNAAGSGLGLYLAKDIVERHEGRIFAASTEGKGSTFRIILPHRA